MEKTANQNGPKIEEIKTFVKETSEKVATSLKEGAEVAGGFAKIVHKHALNAQKELLEHQIDRIEEQIKKTESEARSAARKK